MSKDRTLVFGALAVHRKHLTHEQLGRASEQIANEQLDAELVRSGFLTAAERQELWAEVDRLDREHGGDIQRILKAIQGSAGNSTTDERHASTAKDEPKSEWMGASEESDEDLDATVIAHREETVEKPKPAKLDPPKAGEKSHGTTSGLANANQDSNPFEETLVSKDTVGGILNTIDRRGSTPADVHNENVNGETVDYRPETQSRYTLTRVHGEGGLGQVWLATDPALNREIALKRIRPGKGSSRDAQLRLIKEAQITGQLEHPNIIPVYELEQYDEKRRPYYTMKFLRGDTLNDRIKAYHRKKKKGEDDPLGLVSLLNSFIDICNAIAYAASRGIVHRDLKPQNVMIGDFSEVIVLDWGLAKKIESQEDDSSRKELRLGDILDSTETVAGQVVGSPAYMAPEQASALNDQVDGRTDVYGLGAMLFTILAGQPPHRGTKTGNTARDTIELLNRISTGETPKLRDIAPGIPKGLDAICAKAMHKGARHRYQDARDLAEDVQRFLADDSITVLKESNIQKIGRWLRRHRAWAQSIATAIILISVVSITSAIVVNSAKNLEAAAKTEAVAHFQQARRTIDESLIEISDVLEEYPAVETVRINLLKKAAKEYESLAEQSSEQPELQLEMSRSLVRLGKVRQLIQDFEKSVDAYEKALKVLEPISEKNADNIELKLEIGRCLNGLGICWGNLAPMPESGKKSDSVEKAEEFYKQATKLVNQALKTDPENTDLLRLRANVFANLRLLLANTARLGLAEQNSIRAIDEFQKLSENPGEPEDVESLAEARLALARLLIRQGKSKEVIATLEAALKVYKQLVNSDEDSTMYLSGLADTRVTLGNALHATGDMDRQLSFYIKASADYLELIRARPGVPRYHSNLVAAQTNIAQVLYRRGDAIAAIEKLAVALQQVEALPDSPEKVEQGAYVRVTFGQILRDSGGDADETESAFGSADKLCTDLVQFRPDHSPYRVLHGEVKNNVGVHYLLGNDFEKAEVAFKSALADFDKALELNKGDVAASHGRAWCLNYLADTLYELSRKDQAAKLYKEAIKLRAALCRDNPHNVEYQYAQAWLLLTCQDRSFRDALAGSRIADRLSASMPENGRFLVLKSLGQLRSEDYFGVIKTLNAAVKYRLSYKTPADFIRAMALWLNEDQKGAEAAWKSANNTMERYAPADIKLRRLRAESAELLEIPAPVAPAPEGGESGSAN